MRYPVPVYLFVVVGLLVSATVLPAAAGAKAGSENSGATVPSQNVMVIPFQARGADPRVRLVNDLSYMVFSARLPELPGVTVVDRQRVLQFLAGIPEVQQLLQSASQPEDFHPLIDRVLANFSVDTVIVGTTGLDPEESGEEGEVSERGIHDVIRCTPVVFQLNRRDGSLFVDSSIYTGKYKVEKTGKEAVRGVAEAAVAHASSFALAAARWSPPDVREGLQRKMGTLRLLISSARTPAAKEKFRKRYQATREEFRSHNQWYQIHSAGVDDILSLSKGTWMEKDREDWIPEKAYSLLCRAYLAQPTDQPALYAGAVRAGAATDLAYRCWAEALMRQKRLAEALEKIKAGIELAPKHSALYLDRGLIHTAVGRTDQAHRDFRRAIEVQPHSIRARLLLAQLHSSDLPKAAEFLNEAIELQPDNAKLYLTRLKVLYGLQQYEAALRDLARARELGEQIPQQVEDVLRAKAKQARP